MAYTIIPRHGLLSEFSALNRIYVEGELLLEEQLDGTYRIKVGDGVQNYNSLPYVAGSGGGVPAEEEVFGAIAVSGQSDVIADNAAATLNIAGSNGIAVTTNAATDTITFSPVFGTASGTVCQGDDVRLAGGGGGGTNSFGTIVVSGQSNVVADAAPDTLTLVGASGVAITTNAPTDTVTLSPTYGSASNTICQGNDSRLSDARAPTNHASTHKTAGTDIIRLDELAAPTDVTTLDASTSAHGLLRKGDGIATNFLNGNLAWAAPAGGSATSAFGTIAVSGQSNVVADAAPDTLTLSGSSGIVITTNATNDSVTFAPTFGTTAGTVCQGNDSRLSSTFSVKDSPYLATGNGSTDDTAAINSAIAAGAWFIPPGTYNISAPITLTSNTRIIGAGIGKTIIRHTANNTACFQLNSGVSNCEISRLSITRSVTAIIGGDGINAQVSCSHCMLRDLYIDKQYNGLKLGVTDFSALKDSIILQCTNDGVLMSNVSGNTNGSCQWSLFNVLSAQNVGRGFFFGVLSGPSQCSLGTWQNIATHANSGVGVAISGTSGIPVYGVRIYNSFFGEDGNHEVYLDTYGGMHIIQNNFVELAGVALTGPNLSTAASGVGSGVFVTSNNLDALITGNYVINNSAHGIYTAASASTNISSNRCVGHVGYGVYLDTGATQYIVHGNSLLTNTSGAVGFVNGPATSRIISANIGYP